MRRLAALLSIVLCAAFAGSASSASAHGSAAPLCKAGYYKNVSKHCVKRPRRSATVPNGATAKCRDRTYSFSEHASGTCSHHGGVAVWIHHP